MTRWILVAGLAVVLAGGVQASSHEEGEEGAQTTPVETAPPAPDEGDAGASPDEEGTEDEAPEEAEPQD